MRIWILGQKICIWIETDGVQCGSYGNLLSSIWQKFLEIFSQWGFIFHLSTLCNIVYETCFTENSRLIFFRQINLPSSKNALCPRINFTKNSDSWNLVSKLFILHSVKIRKIYSRAIKKYFVKSTLGISSVNTLVSRIFFPSESKFL